MTVPALRFPVANPPGEFPVNCTPVDVTGEPAAGKNVEPTPVPAVAGSVGGVVEGKLEATGCKAVSNPAPAAGAAQV